MVWLDGFTQLHLFRGLLDNEILRGILLPQEIFDFLPFPLRIQMILRTQFKGIGALCKRKRLAGEVGGLIVHQAKRLPLLKFPRKKK